MAEPPISKRLKKTIESPLDMEILPVESLNKYYQFINLQSDELVGMRRINSRQTMSTLAKTGISKTCRLCTEELTFDTIEERQKHEQAEHFREHMIQNRDAPRCCFPGCPEYEQARTITKINDRACREWFNSHIHEKHEIPQEVFACKLADRETAEAPCMSLQFTKDHARRHLWKIHRIPYGNLTDEVLAASYWKLISEELVLHAIDKEKAADIYEPDFLNELKPGYLITPDGKDLLNESKKTTSSSTLHDESPGMLFGWKLPADPNAHLRKPPSKPATHAFEHFFTVHNALEGR